MAALLGCGDAAALNSKLSLDDFSRTVWTVKDGAPPEIQAMAQTPDGWLWLSTPTGLYRFDGVRFEHQPLISGGVILSNRVFELLARPNGDLWISDVAGLSVRHSNGVVDNVLPTSAGFGAIRTLIFDPDGSMWATATHGLYHFHHGRWREVGREQGWPSDVSLPTALLDQYQRLWVSGSKGVHLYHRDTGRFENLGISQTGGTLTQSPDGRLWVVQGESVLLVPAPPVQPALPRPAYFNQAESRTVQFDRDGNLWGLYCPQGYCMLNQAGQRQDTVLKPAWQPGNRQEAALQQASSVHISVLEDREGNVWVATKDGLERLRENKLTPARIPLPSAMFSMATDTEDGIWTAEAVSGTLWRLAADGVPAAVPSPRYSIVANDRVGALLLAGSRYIERRYRGQVEQIPLPPGRDGQASDLHVLGLLDDGKVLWVATAETGLSGRVDGRWVPRTEFNLPRAIMMMASGGSGKLWIACVDRNVYRYENGELHKFEGAGIGLPTAISVEQELLVGGEYGLQVLQDQRFRKLQAADPDVLNNVSGIVITPDGDRWINGGKGILHIRQADWRLAMQHPDMPLRYQLLNNLEGYPGYALLANHLPSALQASDGQLWFATSNGLVWLDPRRRMLNTVAPQVMVQGIGISGVNLVAQPGLRLPPGSQSFSIQFTAASLRQPESVHFAYQLEGVDADWQDAGTRRTAYYTNVPSGTYRFRAKAVNEDGVASVNDATLAFEIEPTFAQTWWFKMLCGMAVAAVLYLLYRYRLHIVTSRLTDRVLVRMAERERIARTLHDSFLQSVTAVILRFDYVVSQLPADSATRHKLEAAMDYANDTINEGRDKVHELRSGRSDDVESAARSTASLMAETYPDTSFELNVTGTPQSLQPQVAQELCEIARETLRNAFQHANAAKIVVALGYGREHFTLQVQDDGIGMAAETLRGKSAHWGLTGMRERAAGIGARLAIDSKPGEGTRIALSMPARRAYCSRRRWLRWIPLNSDK